MAAQHFVKHRSIILDDNSTKLVLALHSLMLPRAQAVCVPYAL
jgi:hypothetical protein